MSYRISGIDVHKKVLAVVVSDVEVDGEFRFERRMFGSNPEQLRSLAAWLLEQEVEEVVMESTAQYWKPVWETLERWLRYRVRLWDWSLWIAHFLILVGLKLTAVNVILVDLNIRVPLLRQIIHHENGCHRTDRYTGAAVNALSGIDV
jgi:hypothetical protein